MEKFLYHQNDNDDTLILCFVISSKIEIDECQSPLLFCGNKED